MKISRIALILAVIVSIFTISLTTTYAAPKKKDPRIPNTEEHAPPGDPRTPIHTIKPAITRFATSDGIRFYKLGPFGGYVIPRVNIDMQDKYGLRSYEIIFNGHAIVSRNIPGSPKTHRETSLPVNIYPHRPLRSGTYALQAIVTNDYGNTAMKSIDIKVDVREPHIVSYDPGHGKILFTDRETAEIRWTVNANDDFSGIAQVKIMGNMAGVPGIRWSASDSSAPYHIRIPGVERGSSDWVIEVKDNAGVVNRQLFRIQVRPKLTLSPIKQTGKKPSQNKKKVKPKK